MLKSALKNFLAFPGVKTIFILRSDGQVITGVGADAEIQEHLAAVVSFVVAESEALAMQLSQSRVLAVFVEFRDMMLASIPVKEDHFLVLITASDANIGKITYELNKNIPEIRSHI